MADDAAPPAPPAPLRVAWNDDGVWVRSGFAAFLNAHGIQRNDLVARSENGADHEERRYFRVKRQQGGSGSDAPLTDEQVVARVTASLPQHSGACERVAWVPGFFSLPATTRLASLDLYQRGEIYGIDISSGYAVTLLDVQPGDHVLDLCCAPGAKLTMIADALHMHGSITGVDFSRPRIGACRQLVHKYQLVTHGTRTTWRCRLFHADGQTFSVGPLSDWDPHDVGVLEVVLDSDEIRARDTKSQGRKRKNKSARAREAKRLKHIPREAALNEATPALLYDKVLVDAECTHDGSIKHLQKLGSEDAWHAYVHDHLNETEIERIRSLQQALIRNGFALLRTGGTMVYSTCSLSRLQNEEVVRSFLETTPTAALLPIDTTGIPCERGELASTVRFTPAHHTSGLFIAKIRKVEA